MKIALIIFRIGPSHGSILQTYALHKVLTDMGHDVTIIDRQAPINIISAVKRTASLFRKKIMGTYYGPVFYLTEYPLVSMKEINHFISTRLAPYIKSIRSDKEVAALNEMDFDCFVVGSDQTWRPRYVYDVLYYYLDFVSREKICHRVAYAPSFGTSEWEYDDDLTKRCRELVNRFDAVSVREKEGIALCNKHLRVKADLVLDPTLLLKKEDYCSIIKSNKDSKRYVAYSLLDDLATSKDVLTLLSTELNADTLRINSNTLNRKCVEDYIEPSIERWLEGISNARYVVTDSFHATVFSIIFNVPFITIINKKRGASRIMSLLYTCGLEDRYLEDGDTIDISFIHKSIDWPNVNNKIEEARKESLNWLNNKIKK